MKLIKFYFFLIFFFIGIVGKNYALNVNSFKIKVEGNKSISEETIIAYANIKSESDIIDLNKLNEIKKNILITNFFSSVDLEINNKTLVIKVVENPLIEFFVIDGLDEKKFILTKIEKNLNLKENSIFSESLLKRDLSYINSYLQSLGYLNSKVNYTVKKIINNKVNIFINVNLNNIVKIKSVIFLGDKKFSNSDLLDVISSTETNIFDLFSQSSVPTSDRLNYDISLLKNFYLSRGYYDVQIISANFDLVDSNFVNLNFVINSGKKYIIKSTILLNNSKSLQNSNLLFIKNKLLDIENKVYNPKTILDFVKEVNEYFYNLNLNTFISYNIKKNIDNSLILNLNISDDDNILYIRNILVNGNDVTEEKVIRNRISFSEGDVFSDLKLKQSEDSLKSLNIFKDVVIKSNLIKKPNDVDIEILVTEKATGEISAGIGASSYGALFSFMLKENNFLGTGVKVDSNVSLGTQKTLGSVSVFNPDINNSGNSLRTTFFSNKFSYDNAGYENKISGANVAYGYEIFKNVNFEIGMGLDYDQIDAQAGASNLIKSRNGNYLTSKVFYNIYNDKRNQKSKTSSGYTVGFNQSIASFVSDVPYLSNSLYGSFYKNFSDEYQGTIKYHLKQINKLGSDPVKLSDRIFLSENELRGFVFRGYGPKVDNEFIGGNYAYSTTISTTFPNGLPDKWKTSSSLFLDAGSVWGTDFSGSVNENHDLKSSIGVGLTWSSPLGPLSISYAEPILKNSGDSTQNFTFRIGNVF